MTVASFVPTLAFLAAFRGAAVGSVMLGLLFLSLAQWLVPLMLSVLALAIAYIAFYTWTHRKWLNELPDEFWNLKPAVRELDVAFDPEKAAKSKGGTP